MRLVWFNRYVVFLAILKGIFVISLMISLLLWSIPLLSFNSSIWRVFQERSGVVLNENVATYNNLIIEFFKGGLKLDFLNEDELGHMQNVKSVITIVNIALAFSFAFLMLDWVYLSKSEKRFLLEAARRTSLIVFAVTLIISIIILTNFNATFLSFHKIVFVKNFIFPGESLLKTLYPDKFFYGISALYLLSVLIVSLVVFIVTHRLKLK